MAAQIEAATTQDYSDYAQDSTYEYDSGLLALPVAGPTAAVKVIRLHGGFGLRHLNFNAAREGRPPVIPPMQNTVGGTDTFLSGSFATALPVPIPNASGYSWGMSGDYTFVQLTPRVVGTDTFPVGSYPFSCQTQDLAALTSVGSVAVPPFLPYATTAAYNGFWNANVATAGVNLSTGNWSWPFLAYPPVFSSSVLLNN